MINAGEIFYGWKTGVPEAMERVSTPIDTAAHSRTPLETAFTSTYIGRCHYAESYCSLSFGGFLCLLPHFTGKWPDFMHWGKIYWGRR
ncbi:hypothetical protein Zmor_000040 [Zophobas morio]|uniref:Uncharacterized protein n=1 Tax=Zophobas morio TaxID=2755281 RepID=A0AA38MQT7_9CUCU|nr:hypothetical protein Zmor_000040 [Zophobas morio]